MFPFRGKPPIQHIIPWTYKTARRKFVLWNVAESMLKDNVGNQPTIRSSSLAINIRLALIKVVRKHLRSTEELLYSYEHGTSAQEIDCPLTSHCCRNRTRHPGTK